MVDNSVAVEVANLALERVEEDATNLMTNGDFALGSTGWTDYSGALVVAGTHDGGQNQQDLEDSGTDFVVALPQGTVTSGIIFCTRG